MAMNEIKLPKILIVDDEKNLVLMLAKILRRHGFEVFTAHDGEEGVKILEERMKDGDLPEDSDRPDPIDILMTDLQMPRMDGMKLLKVACEKYPSLPVVVLTGHGSIQSAVEAMKAGAVDYLIKPANPEEILIVLRKALELRNLKAENRQLRAELGQVESNYEIIGHSQAIESVLNMIRMVSRNRSTVLISGESGTGKELVARGVHDSGPFARFPFIAVNCGALSETLLESQLFGHKRGAFTGAVNDHIGFFEAAEGGTLFLDEISEMSPHLQVKLLRAIQEREVIPVGDTHPRKINLRLVCATNRDLEYEVRRRNFRQDLFYRLSVVNVYLAPLRDRKEDIADLVGHFILRYSKDYDVAPKTVQPDVMRILHHYSWPGNIRELENIVERSFALSNKDTITLEELPPQLFRDPDEAMAAVTPMDDEQMSSGPRSGDHQVIPAGRSARSPQSFMPPMVSTPKEKEFQSSGEEGFAPELLDAAPQSSGFETLSFTEPFVPKAPEKPLTLDEMEKRQIVDALRRARGKKVEAAKILGIDRKRLYRKMKKYELN
jgi:DNA-binding NtrC family response regulator